MSKKSCPVFIVYALSKNKQDFLDISKFRKSVLQNGLLPALRDNLSYCDCTRILTAYVRKFNFWP